MDVIYGLIPMVLFLGLLVVVMFIWMAKKGYFDDMDGQANRILWDDDELPQNTENKNTGDKAADQAAGKADAEKGPSQAASEEEKNPK